MSHDPGPLGELGENLSGKAAGHYSPREDGDFHHTSETQAPFGRDAAPLARHADAEQGDDDGDAGGATAS